MQEIEEFLRELKKEIIEARALIIKSNNLVNSLAAEVRSIARRQASYERRISWNSIAAYVLFAILAYLGIRLAFAHQESRYLAELDEAVQATEKLKKEIKALKSKTKSHPRDEKEILALHQMIHDGNREQALDAYVKLDKDVLTETEKALFKDQIEAVRAHLSILKYNKGLGLVQKKKWPEAVESFKESLDLKKDAGHAPAARIEMANALRLQGKPREAIAILQKLIEEHLDRELADDAYWVLALCFDEAHQKDEAVAILRNLIRQYPDSQYVRMARIKIGDLRLRLFKEKE